MRSVAFRILDSEFSDFITLLLNVIQSWRKLASRNEFLPHADSFDPEEQFRFRHVPCWSRGRHPQNSGRQIRIGGLPDRQRQKSLLSVKRATPRRFDSGHFTADRSDERPDRLSRQTKDSGGTPRFYPWNRRDPSNRCRFESRPSQTPLCRARTFFQRAFHPETAAAQNCFDGDRRSALYLRMGPQFPA